MQKLRYKISKTTALTIYNSLFKPQLTYCITIWGNSANTNINPLYVLQNKYLKSCLMLPRRTKNSSIYGFANTLSIYNLYKHHSAILIYKFIHYPNQIPTTLQMFFSSLTPTHNYSTRSSTDTNIFVSMCSTNTRKKFIKIEGPIFWNSIPLHIKSASSIQSFKRLLKTHLLEINS